MKTWSRVIAFAVLVVARPGAAVAQSNVGRFELGAHW